MANHEDGHQAWLPEFVKQLRTELSVVGEALLAQCHGNIKRHKEIMAALDNLNASIVKLTASVDAAVAIVTAPRITEAQVQAAADAVTAQSAKLDAAVTPPTP